MSCCNKDAQEECYFDLQRMLPKRHDGALSNGNLQALTNKSQPSQVEGDEPCLDYTPRETAIPLTLEHPSCATYCDSCDQTTN